MCGRYYVSEDMLDEMEEIVLEVDRKIRDEKFGKDIYPTNPAPVITGGSNGLKMTVQHWGYPGFQGKGVIFNARAESVFTKKMFASGIRQQRAVIPANSFYEWNQSKEKNIFFRKDSKVMYLAGFYDNFIGDNKFVIVTTAANDSMIKTHDRMPLVLEKEQLDKWIYDDSATEMILRQIPAMLDKQTDYEQQTLF